MKNSIIETVNLTKEYSLKVGGKIKALNNVSFNIEEGEIFGLLGPNGAGKTTLVSILATLIQPTSGKAKVLGYDIIKNPKNIKSKIGLMLGDEMIYYRMTGMDNLKFFTRLYRIKNKAIKIREITETLGIYNKMEEYVSNYSRGQKLRLALSRVLLIEPEILFLDEPLLGLDPKTTRELIDILQGLNKTILLTSHQMHIVQQLCKRIAFLNKGSIIKIDNQENFINMLSQFIRVRFEINKKGEKKELKRELKSLDFINKISRRKGGYIVSMSDRKNYPDLLTCLGKYPVQKVQEIEPTLDDVFIELSK
ncbi:MAG: ATP-binding cassette domain-containing protein [Candidatus Lokiarchaeota archaeon]|nr:ATP-binding cassette domain-containing protein [Candidatus Lokiarchaeota archaeon]